MRSAVPIVLIALVAGCERPNQTVSAGTASRPVSAAPPMPQASISPSATQNSTQTVAVPKEARIPFDFPAVQISGNAGDHVLAPPRSFLDDALEGGAQHQTFIYYAGVLRKPGRFASEVETLTHELATLPNSLIVAIQPGEAVSPGDIVLTSWASGAGMQRAIVVEGGTPKEPSVRYLDMSLDNPSGWGKKADRLAANTFHKLSKAGEVGSNVVCKSEGRPSRQIVVRRASSRLLGLGFAGKLRAWSDSDCQPLALVPKLAAGDEIFVPLFAGFVRAKVERVQPEIGRVFARYAAGDERREAGFSLLNVATKLP